MSQTTLEAALDSVLRNAVANNDGAVIEAYQEIYQHKVADRPHQERVHAALRFGLLVGLELRKAKEPRICP